MNRLRKVAVLSALIDRLQEKGSWCGETHIQKATYFLQELLEVPTEFDFILYKHGPFSFDLRDELTAMRADGLLELRPMPIPYGPTLVPTQQSREIQKRFPTTLRRYERYLDFVADNLANKGVADLEKLATALYVTREEQPGTSIRRRAERINQLKPHVSVEEAKIAVEAFEQILHESEELQA